jgi:hypothetical protein
MRIIARRTLREFVEARAGQKDQPALSARRMVRRSSQCTTGKRR